MRDPLPENIDGAKVHNVNWDINVGHVGLALAGLAIAYVLWSAFEPAEGGDNGEETEAGVVEEPTL